MAFGILGTGSAAPERILTNHDLEQMVDTTDEWIRTRSGIRERRIAGPETATSDLASEAGRHAIEAAGLTPADIDLIVVATFSPDHLIPSTACLVMAKLDIPDCPAFDINGACTGFIYALTVVHGLLQTGMARHALVVGADCTTKHINFQDRTTCVLFGDGAGAVVLGAVAEGSGIRSEFLSANGRMADRIRIPAGGTRQPVTHEVLEKGEHYVQMSGNDVFKFAVRIMEDALLEAARRANIAVTDLDWIIPHQANGRIIDGAVKRLGIDPERVIVNIDRYGNTSAASVPLALDEAVRDGRIRRGQLVGVVAFGGGLTWGSAVVRY